MGITNLVVKSKTSDAVLPCAAGIERVLCRKDGQ